jgi:hypothetical protein
MSIAACAKFMVLFNYLFIHVNFFISHRAVGRHWWGEDFPPKFGHFVLPAK